MRGRGEQTAETEFEKMQFIEWTIYIKSTKPNMLKANLLNHQFAKFTKFMECGYNTSLGTLSSFVRVYFWSWSNFSVYTRILGALNMSFLVC